MGDEPFCCECKRDFPVAEEPASWRMGFLRPLTKLPSRLRERYRSWLNHPEGHYLCGNCYFDATD